MMNLIQCIPFVTIVWLQVEGTSKHSEHFNITEFEVLSNRTVESLDESLQQVLNCSSIFTISESMRHIKICAAEELEFHDPVHSRKRRDMEFIEPFASDETEDDIDSEDSFENIDDNKTRIVRGIVISNDKLRAYLPWKFLELRSIRKTPCIGACVLEELQVLNDTDTPDRQMIVNRIIKTASNISTEAAESITDRCIDHYGRATSKIQPSKGDVEVQKCRAAVKLGICLSKKSYDFCKADPYQPITAISKAESKNNN